MSEQPLGYAARIEPTEAELNLIARLRQLRGMCIVDSDSMTIWPALRAEYCNGKRPGAIVSCTPVVINAT